MTVDKQVLPSKSDPTPNAIQVYVQWVRIAEKPKKRVYFHATKDGANHYGYIDMDGTDATRDKIKDLIASWEDGAITANSYTFDAMATMYETGFSGNFATPPGSIPQPDASVTLGPDHQKAT